MKKQVGWSGALTHQNGNKECGYCHEVITNGQEFRVYYPTRKSIHIECVIEYKKMIYGGREHEYPNRSKT